jgi:hypothetical protein
MTPVPIIPPVRPSAPASAIAQSARRLSHECIGSRRFDSRSDGLWIGRWHPRDFEMQLRGAVAMLPCWCSKSNFVRCQESGVVAVLWTPASEARADRVNRLAWQPRADLAASQLSQSRAMLLYGSSQVQN